METLKINIPNGYEVDTFDKASGAITFKEKRPKKVMERIKTIADVLADHGLTPDQFDDSCVDLDLDESSYRLLKLITKSLNEEWVPDWNNESESKYYPWFYMGGSSGFRFDVCAYWDALSHVGSRLCFKSRELAEYAANQFTGVYKNFMTI